MINNKIKYLETCRENQIKEYILSTHGVAIFDENAENVIWANTQAAQLLSINPMGQNTKNIRTIPQIKAACKKIENENKQNAVLKSIAQFNAKSIGFEMSKINFHNKNAFLFISQKIQNKGYKINQMAENFVEVLGKYNVTAIVLDCKWNIIAGTDKIKKDEIAKVTWKVKHENIAEGYGKINNTKMIMIVSEIKIENENMYVVIVPEYSTTEKENEIVINKEIESQQNINSNKDASVRTFSAKTENVGENKMGRWYYKNIEAKNIEKNTKENIETKKIENSESKNNGELSESEKLTFKEIGEKLSGKNTKEKIKKEKNKKEFIPAAFAVVKKNEEYIDTSVLAKLPVPVLVYKNDKLLFANHEFLKITGYESLKEIIKHGGTNTLFRKINLLNKLFKGTKDDKKIVHSNGHTLNVVTKIQYVPWENTKAIMMTLRQKYEKNKNGETH